VNIERLSNNNPHLGSVYSRKKATLKNDVLAKKLRFYLFWCRKNVAFQSTKKLL